MKKIAFIFFAGMLLLLAACSDNSNTASDTNSDKTVSEESAGSETTNDLEEDKTDDENSDHEENNADTNAEDQADDDSDSVETASDSQLQDFPEYDTLTDEFDVAALEPEIATDNPDKRVILYADNHGKKQYKSIFIKHDSRLKIISLDDEGEIFNEELDLD